jgi:hypothetical protein
MYADAEQASWIARRPVKAGNLVGHPVRGFAEFSLRSTSFSRDRQIFPGIGKLFQRFLWRFCVISAA